MVKKVRFIRVVLLFGLCSFFTCGCNIFPNPKKIKTEENRKKIKELRAAIKPHNDKLEHLYRLQQELEIRKAQIQRLEDYLEKEKSNE